jgi:hypothetical protein
MQLANTTYEDELELLLRQRVDERAARTTLRGQIARLERELASLVVDLWEAGRTGLPSTGEAAPAGARLLSIGELEEVRDALLERIDAARLALAERAQAQRHARAHLDEMLEDPASHRFHIVYRAELGEPSCGAYQVLPRLGLVGMLFGWWCIKISSGCPLSMYYRSNFKRREHLLWRPRAKLELVVAVIVLIAIIATILVFLLVLHDFPLRTGEPT